MQSVGKVLRIGTVRYNWPMSAHASQPSIAHCTDSEDLPSVAVVTFRFFITRLIKALFINKLSCVAIQYVS